MKCLKTATADARGGNTERRVRRYPGFVVAGLAIYAFGTGNAIPVGMETTTKSNEALISYLSHAVESACKEQVAFAEVATKDVEGALRWRAEDALIAVFTRRHAQTALDQVKLGRDVLLVYENLVDRLLTLASAHNNDSDNIAEQRAVAVLARSLKEWVS